MDDEKCSICDQDLEPNCKRRVISGDKLKSFFEAATARQDRKANIFKNATIITVHASCAKSYTSISHITAHLKRSELQGASTSSCTPSDDRLLRSGGNFNFSELCFFCEEDASDYFIKKQIKKPKVLRVEVTVVSKKDELRSNIISYKDYAFDQYALQIIDRISRVDNLHAVKARYHRDCYKKFLKLADTDHVQSDGANFLAAKFINDYILLNSDECQFSLQEILSTYEGPKYIMQMVKEELALLQPENLVFHSDNARSMVSLKSATEKILSDNWYKKSSRETDESDEKKRIMLTGAKFIKQDIRSRMYITDEYPAPEKFLDTVETDVPESLRSVLEEIIKSDKKITPNTQILYDRKITSIAHNIISAARPRSFLSCLHIGLSAFLYKKFGSKKLLQALSSLGMCASYEEMQLFESSIVITPQILEYKEDHFTQLIFDNADHNVRTIDGKNTLHVMGGVMCVTPSEKVTTNKCVPRIKKPLTAREITKFGKQNLNTTFTKPKKSGFLGVTVLDLNTDFPIEKKITLAPLDFAWIFSKKNKELNYKGWHGFMESVHAQKDFKKSRIIYLPFINNPPNKYETVYTALLQAEAQRQQSKLADIFVTFDQPLYLKAREIKFLVAQRAKAAREARKAKEANGEDVEDEEDVKDIFEHVHIRLGGFHLAMSFLGCIGFVMKGSGLKNILCTIYAENTVDKLLDGHLYARAVRGHLLVSLSLYLTILQTSGLSLAEMDVLKMLLKDEKDILKQVNSPEFEQIFNKLLLHLEEYKNRGPTAKLWITYLEMTSLIRSLIASERSGNWDEQLIIIRKMLPFFFACGHFNYARSVIIYLQDMLLLKDPMDKEEYKNFTESGFFTIRRTNKFFCGTFSDMIIEQEFMRNLKDPHGGLTHGRTVTDESISGWILTMPFLVDIIKVIEQFAGVKFTTSDQHIDATDSRIKRDKEDVQKCLQFQQEYDAFPISDSLMCIVSGTKGDASINCHMTYEVGTKLVDTAYKSETFAAIQFKKSHRIKSLQCMHAVTVNNSKFVINPTLLFQRIASAVEDTSLQFYLAHELAPWPESIFENGFLRKNNKSDLYKFFNPVLEPSNNKRVYIIDGGFLLRKVVWPACRTFSEIFKSYLQYVLKFKTDDTEVRIIFDGYDKSGTKDEERRIREFNKVKCVDVEVEANKNSPVPQEKFLLNRKNKSQLVKQLAEFLKKSGIHTQIAEEDADALIVHTAVKSATAEKSAVIVGTDTDLIVLLTQLTSENDNVFLLKIDGGEKIWYGSNSFLFQPLRPVIALLHSFCGCDTTSAFYYLGKTKIFDRFSKNKNPELFKQLSSFYESTDKDTIINIGKEIVLYLYSNKKNPKKISLNTFRYSSYKKSIRTKSFKIAKLPPTESAAAQHSLRVYLQIMKWMNINTDLEAEVETEFDPTAWGWELKNDQLYPRTISPEDKLIPDDILQFISCSCRSSTNCLKNCGCVKNGLKCSEYCKNCIGLNCKNSTVVSMNVELNDENENEDTIENLSNQADETNSDVSDSESVIQELSIDGDSTMDCDELNAILTDSEDDNVEDDFVNDEPPSKKQKISQVP